MTQLNIVFVLPTKNEEKTIGLLLNDLKKISDTYQWKSHYLLVDDSNDQTQKIATTAGAEVLPGEFRGLGFSMLKGLAYAKQKNPDYIVTLDTDGQVDPSEIKNFIDTIQLEKLDVILSSRFLKNDLIKYKYPIINFLGNRILVFILRFATNFPFTDSHGGIRVLKPEALTDLKLIGLHTYVQETLISFCKNGYKVKELPSQWNERRYSHSRVLKSIGQYIARTLPALLYLMNFHKLLFCFSMLAIVIHFLIDTNSKLYISIGFMLGLFSLFILIYTKKATHIRDFHQ